MFRVFSYFVFILFSGLSIFAQEGEGAVVLKVPDTTINEIVIRTDPKQNLENKVWDMGPYYYCKFSREDERKAVLDGWILLNPYRIEEIRRSVAGEHSIQVRDVSIISGKENRRFGEYEVCAGGTKYTYVRRGDHYVGYKRLK